MSLETLIKRGVDTPVDFEFIKRVVGKSTTIRMVDHESGLPNTPSLADVFKGHQAVAILLHVIQGKTPIGHWILLLQKTNKRKIALFDSLGMGLYKLYKFTHEEPKLLHALKGHAVRVSFSRVWRLRFRSCKVLEIDKFRLRAFD